MQRDQRRLQRVRDAARLPHHRLGRGVGADQGHDAVAGGPGAGDGVGAHPAGDVGIHPIRRAAQRQLAQRGEVAFLEEAPQRPARLVRAVDAALAHPLDQFGGRDVDQLDRVGFRQHAVGHRLGDAHAGDARDGLGQAFQVLDVHGGPDLDAGLAQLLHILPALRMPAAGRVAVGEFVEQQDRRPARQRGVEVELLQLLAAIGDAGAGQDRQVADRRLGLGAAVGLDDAGQHIRPGGAPPMRLGQHLHRLADARGGAEEHLQPPAPLPPGEGEQGVGIGAGRVLAHPASDSRCRALPRASLRRLYVPCPHPAWRLYARAAYAAVRSSGRDSHVLDLLLPALGAGFFGLMIAYAAACGRV